MVLVSDPERIREVLVRAGFVDIQIAAHDVLVGNDAVQDMVDVCSSVGALGAVLRANPDLRPAALGALKEALLALDGPQGPRLRAATWVVIARAGDSGTSP